MPRKKTLNPSYVQLSLFDDADFEETPAPASRKSVPKKAQSPVKSKKRDKWTELMEQARRQMEEAIREGHVIRIVTGIPCSDSDEEDEATDGEEMQETEMPDVEDVESAFAQENAQTPPASDPVLRIRSKNKRLKVTFADGTVFCEMYASDTMILTLNHLGPERVAALRMVANHLPLVSREVYPAYAEWTKDLADGWHLLAQSDTNQKYLQLRSIFEQLHLDAKIEIGEFDVMEKSVSLAPRIKKTKRKAMMSATFADGFVIPEDMSGTVFVAILEHIGMEKVRRTHMQVSARKALLTSNKLYPEQVQLASGLWLTVPTTIKAKQKVLQVISSMTHVKFTVDVTE